MTNLVLMAGKNLPPYDTVEIFSQAEMNDIIYVGRKKPSMAQNFIHEQAFNTLNGVDGAIIVCGSVSPAIKIQDWAKCGSEMVVIFDMQELAGDKVWKWNRNAIPAKWQIEMSRVLENMRFGIYKEAGFLIGKRREERVRDSEAAKELVAWGKRDDLTPAKIIEWFRNAPKPAKEDWTDGTIHPDFWTKVPTDISIKKHIGIIDEVAKDKTYVVPSSISKDAAFKCAAGGVSAKLKVKKGDVELVGRVFSSTGTFTEQGVDDLGRPYVETRQSKVDIFAVWDVDGTLLTTKTF